MSLNLYYQGLLNFKTSQKLVIIKPNRISDYSEVREVNTSKNRIAKPI